MDVKFAPELENSLIDIAERCGRAPSELVQEVMAGHVADLSDVKATLDSRYDDLASGRVKAIDGEAFLEDLLKRTKYMIDRPRK